MKFSIGVKISLVALIIGIALANSNSYVFGNQVAKFFFFFKGIGIILIISAITIMLNIKKFCLKITWLDILLLAYLLYITINRLFVAHTLGYTIQYYELLGLSLLYITLRSFNKSYIVYLYTALMVSGIIQAIYGNLQLFGIYPSNHNAFSLTGGFFNPGPYAGYLAPIFAIALVLFFFPLTYNNFLKEELNKFIKPGCFWYQLIHQFFIHLPFLTIITIILALPASRSRAAWVAVIFSTFWIISKKYCFKSYFFKYFDSYLKKVICGLSCVTLISCFILFIYHFGKGSADGRFLIWKVTIQMIKDKPLFGHGYENYSANYMDYQAKYFAENLSSGEDIVADENRFAYNELLRIFSEIGFLGLFIFLGILYSVYKARKKAGIKENERLTLYVAQVGFLSLIVFSLFSYTNIILPLKLAGVSLLSVIAIFSKPVVEKDIYVGWFTRSGIVVGISIITIFLYPYFKKLQVAQNNWMIAYSAYQVGAYEASLIAYKNAFPLLKNDGDFLSNYGKALSMNRNYEQAIIVLSRTKDHLTNSIVYTALGDCYKGLGKNTEAEQAYYYAWQMIPNRFYPKYLLAKLFEETGQKQKAVKIARELLNKKAKIESSAIKEIQFQMKLLIKNNSL